MADEDPLFLAFNAFETTAFSTSFLVACYSLISNPTGRQSSTDQSEYQVYSGWRLALLTIVAQSVLMVVVIIQQANKPDVPSNAKGWLLGLMIAPWAPLAGQVRDTVTSGLRVRRMMKSRLVRNELAAIMRDRFKFGQRGIALPAIVFHATGMLPSHPIESLQANRGLVPYIDDLRVQATAAAQTDEPHALELGSLWVTNQSLQPSSIPRSRLFFWKLISMVDVLARVWTDRDVDVLADPMPNVTSIVERARYLDIVDFLQQGGTVSDELMTRGMRGKFCERCMLATRGAVESFMESSERGHTDLRAKRWLRDIGMNWRGIFERVMDVMWEATFIDGKAGRVECSDEDKSPHYGDRSKITTTKTLALLFIIMRSLLRASDEHSCYSSVAAIVRDGPFARVWWDRYWAKLAQRLGASPNLSSDTPAIALTDQVRAEFKAVLRDMIDEDMDAIVYELLHHPIKDSLCMTHDCLLRGGSVILHKY